MLSEIIHKIAGQFEQSESRYSPRPSLAGPETCLRKLGYWALGIPAKPFSDRTILVFDDGHWHEELTADWIRKSAYKLHSEQMGVNIPTTLEIPAHTCRWCNVEIPANHLHGHIDGIISDALEVSDTLYEHKAINHFSFEAYWRGKLPLNYLTQCCMYIKALHLIDRDINAGILLIKNKNTAQYMELLFTYNMTNDVCEITERIAGTGKIIYMNERLEGVVEKSIARFQAVADCKKTGVLPDREYDRNTWQCDYCLYGAGCWEEFDKEIEKLNPTIELPDDIVQLAYRATEAGRQSKQFADIQKESRDAVLKQMMDAGFNKGAKDGISITIRQQDRQTIDKDATPESILSQCAFKKSISTIVDIRHKKQENKS